MLLRIVALGALAYAGYRYLSNERSKEELGQTPDVRLAGGPLSKDAFLVHADDEMLKP
jgi:hypothetical protein